MFSKQNVQQALKTKIRSQSDINKMKNILYKQHLINNFEEEKEEIENDEEMTEERIMEIANDIEGC